MASTLAPTLDEIRTNLDARGAALQCTVCGETDADAFTLERATLRGEGRRQTYGNYRLQRSEVVCETCGHVESFDVERLRKPVPAKASRPRPVTAVGDRDGAERIPTLTWAA